VLYYEKEINNTLGNQTWNHYDFNLADTANITIGLNNTSMDLIHNISFPLPSYCTAASTATSLIALANVLNIQFDPASLTILNANRDSDGNTLQDYMSIVSNGSRFNITDTKESVM